MDKIEHLGIAVEDLETAMKTYTALFGAPAYKVEEVASEGVRTAFFRSGPNKIELLEGIGTQNPISRFISKKGEGIHHVAFAVEDIRSAMERLASEGFTLLNEEPKPGADNKLVAFVHPKDAHGVLIELCQERSDQESRVERLDA